VGKLTVRYEDGLKESLADPEEAAAYLNAALDEGSQEVFLLALRDVAKARGVSKVADLAELNRENVYRLLSAKGNPRLSSLNALLRTLGLRFAVEVENVDA
jgi:probable addiction module antidote protein